MLNLPNSITLTRIALVVVFTLFSLPLSATGWTATWHVNCRR